VRAVVDLAAEDATEKNMVFGPRRLAEGVQIGWSGLY
jgi:hypothetical protein